MFKSSRSFLIKLSAKFIRFLLMLSCFIGITISAGCSWLKFEPWVKPYERQNLADPIMAFGRDPVSDNYLHHVYQAREAARGAEGSAGGGCGCN